MFWIGIWDLVFGITGWDGATIYGICFRKSYDFEKSGFGENQ